MYELKCPDFVTNKYTERHSAHRQTERNKETKKDRKTDRQTDSCRGFQNLFPTFLGPSNEFCVKETVIHGLFEKGN